MPSPVMTFFMSLRSQPAWLALGRQQRADYIAEHVRPIFARWPQVRLRFYDAVAFSGRWTDRAVFETADLRAYGFLVDGLRDSAFCGLPYFEVLAVMPAREDGYVDYNAEMGVVG